MRKAKGKAQKAKRKSAVAASLLFPFCFLRFAF
jgi:hypothetical protein